MKLIWFLADHVFRFRYRDPFPVDENGVQLWELDTYEEESDKMLVDFFFMGFVIGAIITSMAAGIIWIVLP